MAVRFLTRPTVEVTHDADAWGLYAGAGRDAAAAAIDAAVATAYNEGGDAGVVRRAGERAMAAHEDLGALDGEAFEALAEVMAELFPGRGG